MVNLVRQNDILQLIDWYQTEYCEAETYFEEFRRDVESWTAVDAVPVVRCKDCKFFDKEQNESGSWEWCKAWGRDCESESYCSYGQCREDNVNRCVCCGAIIPEGRMVCPSCERRAGERAG